MADLTYMDCWHYIAPLIAKASGENQTKLRAAAEKLLEAFGEKVKRNG